MKKIQISFNEAAKPDIQVDPSVIYFLSQPPPPSPSPLGGSVDVYSTLTWLLLAVVLLLLILLAALWVAARRRARSSSGEPHGLLRSWVSVG